MTIDLPDRSHRYIIRLQPGQVTWLRDLVNNEMISCRNAHSDGSNECGHCSGAGLVRI
jgi:hypothetical protein